MPRPKKWNGPVIRKTIQISEDLAGELADAVSLAELPEADVLRTIFVRGLDSYVKELCEERTEKLKQRIRDLRVNREAWSLYLANRNKKELRLPHSVSADIVPSLKRALEAYWELSDLDIDFQPADITGEELWHNMIDESQDKRRRQHMQSLEMLRKHGYLDIYANSDNSLHFSFDEVIDRDDLPWVQPARKALRSLVRSQHLVAGGYGEKGRPLYSWTGRHF